MKFLLFFQVAAVSSDRGNGVRRLVETVRELVGAEDSSGTTGSSKRLNLQNLSEAIKPILTRCDPKDEEIDIECLRGDILDILLGEVDEKGGNGVSLEADDSGLNQFYESISDKFDIVDPLNRRFPANDDFENQALPLNDLKNELRNMASFPGYLLEAPIPRSLKS